MTFVHEAGHGQLQEGLLQEGRGWNGELPMSTLHLSHEKKLAQGKLLLSLFIHTLCTEQCHDLIKSLHARSLQATLPARTSAFVHSTH